MTQHDHLSFVPGCFRCDLNRDEIIRQDRDRAPCHGNDGTHISGCLWWEAMRDAENERLQGTINDLAANNVALVKEIEELRVVLAEKERLVHRLAGECVERQQDQERLQREVERLKAENAAMQAVMTEAQISVDGCHACFGSGTRPLLQGAWSTTLGNTACSECTPMRRALAALAPDGPLETGQ